MFDLLRIWVRRFTFAKAPISPRRLRRQLRHLYPRREAIRYARLTPPVASQGERK